MSADRILQLKLIADVGEISRKMGTVESDVGRVNKAFDTIRGFAAPAIAGVGLDIASHITGALSDATTEAGELRRELVNLESLSVALGIDDASAKATLEGLTEESQALGFSAEADIARGFARALAVTEDVDASIAIVRAGFDLARASGDDLGTAVADAMDAIVAGGEEAEEKLGVFGETMDERMQAFQDKYGNFAEDFALTDEGEWATINARFEGHMVDLGGLIDQWILDTKGALVDMFDDWEFIFEEGPKIIGKALDAMSKKVGEAFAGIRAMILGAFNAVIGAWNALDPSIDISIHEGFEVLGQRVGVDFDFHSGDLIPDMSYIPLAGGGIVTRPTLALIGEGDHDEAVIPLDGRHGMGNTYNISVTVGASSPADVGRAVVEAIEAYERRAGASWRGAA